MSFYQGLKDYLDLHKRERRGLTVLVILLFSVLGLLAAMPYIAQPKIHNQAEIERKVNKIIAAKNSEESTKSLSVSQEKKIDHKSTSGKEEKELFPFDPNNTTAKEWEKLGLNSGQVKTINNYLAKGGKFYKTDDLAKIYSISEKQFSELRPYINIPTKPREKNYSDKREPKTSQEQKTWEESWRRSEEKKVYIKKHVDINSADTIALKSIRGIGSFYANKIVEQREKLGGFIAKEQLLDIWNFKPELLDQISEEIHLGEMRLDKIRINHCTAKELANHPYFSWKQAKALIAYREQHGMFSNLGDIAKSHLINEELCQKVKPYLTLD